MGKYTSFEVYSKILAKLIVNQKIRYILVGGSSTVICYTLSLLLYWAFSDSLHIIIIGIINSIIGITLSFFGHRYFVFRSKASWWSEYLKMYIVNSYATFINVILLWFLVDIITVPFWISQASIAFIMIFFMYFAHNHYTFKVKNK